MPLISTDALRGYSAELHLQPFFARLAPELQARALAEAVERGDPARAAEIRAWTPATRAMIAALDEALRERQAPRETELWRLRNRERELVCVAVATMVGVDMRLLEAGEMLRTELCRDALTVQVCAARWKKSLIQVGWIQPCQSNHLLWRVTLTDRRGVLKQ